MSKTKQLSQYNGTAWETPIDIGADAANVDYPLSDDTTKPLDEVIGSVGASDSNLVTQISNKLSTNGAIDNTVLNQGPDITTYPTSGQVNDGNLVVSAEDSSHTLWSKFNAFRGRVASNFSNYIKATLVTSGTGVSSSATDAQVYSAKAIQNYFNSVIGYNSASDVSSLGSVASQLSSLNSNIAQVYQPKGVLSSTTTLNDLLTLPSGAYQVNYNFSWLPSSVVKYGTLFAIRTGTTISTYGYILYVDTLGKVILRHHNTNNWHEGGWWGIGPRYMDVSVTLSSSHFQVDSATSGIVTMKNFISMFVINVDNIYIETYTYRNLIYGLLKNMGTGQQVSGTYTVRIVYTP